RQWCALHCASSCTLGLYRWAPPKVLLVATIPIHEPVARERAHTSAFFSAGFRPFFLLGAAWAAIAVPLWLAAYVHGYALPGALPAMVWHAHEMIYGYSIAAVTGFLLTAIPNWTGRLPSRACRSARSSPCGSRAASRFSPLPRSVRSPRRRSTWRLPSSSSLRWQGKSP